MRQVAIAQAWIENGGEAILLAAKIPFRMLEPHIEGIEARQLERFAYPIPDQAREVAAVAASRDAGWIAIDGYRFDDSVESILTATGRPLLAMDDYGHAVHSAAQLVVFPHSPDRPREKNWLEWQQSGSPWKLSGLKYVPVRKEFQGKRPAPATRLQDQPFRIVVTMGGVDPANVTGLVCQAIADVRMTRKMVLDVILGPDYQHRSELERALETSGGKVVLHAGVASPGQLFGRADLVVSAGGSTLYDLACLGVPSIAIEIAPNQRPVIRAMVDAGCAISCTDDSGSRPNSIARLVGELLGRTDRLPQMASAGPVAIDGRGAARIVRRMMAGRLAIRAAMPEDCLGLLRLRNDHLVRANSICLEAVGLSDHQVWLGQVLEDRRRHLYVLESGGGKILGQCRLDIDADAASGTISVSLSDKVRGCSVAKGFVSGVVGRVCSSPSVAQAVRVLNARIRKENEVSRRLFEALGFTRLESATESNGPLENYRLVLPTNNRNAAGSDVLPELCCPPGGPESFCFPMKWRSS